MNRPRFVAALSVLICLVLHGPAGAEDDARWIIEKAFEAAKANEIRAREYVFHERVEERRFGRNGREKKRESHTWDVTLFEGGDYRRLIAKNDRPLDPAAQAKEQRKLDKHIRKLESQSPRKRARRRAEIEKERREGEEFLREITRAFDFRRLREEEIDGVPTWVISAEPKEGYDPPSREARVLTRVRATLWVSREDYGWVQADIETLDDISWMAVFQLKQGAQIRFRQRKLDGEVWLTERWDVRMRARVAFVYRLDAEIIGTYDNFRRFVTQTQETGWTATE